MHMQTLIRSTIIYICIILYISIFCYSIFYLTFKCALSVKLDMFVHVVKA